MKLTATYTIAAPREKVFAALIDPDVLRSCIPGCDSLTLSGQDTYDAQLKVGVAGLKGTYAGKARLSDIAAPESFVLAVEGKGGPGFVRGRAEMHVADKGDQTSEVACSADVQVGGLIAAVGSRLIEAVARKMMDDFFRCFTGRVGV